MNILKYLFVFFIVISANIVNADENNKNTISVTGNAEIDVVPDEVHVSLMIQKDSKILSEAQAQNDEVANKILRILENSLRINKKDIQTNYINVRPVYEYPQCGTRRCTKLEFSRFETKKGIMVKLKEIDKLQELLEKALEAGVTHIQSVNFATSKFEELKNKAQVMAAINAKERAVRIANSIGSSVGEPYRIRVNQSYNHQPVHKYARSMALESSSADSANTISVGQIKVMSTVNAEFMLN